MCVVKEGHMLNLCITAAITRLLLVCRETSSKWPTSALHLKVYIGALVFIVTEDDLVVT